MNKPRVTRVAAMAVVILIATVSWAAKPQPLRLIKSIPLPMLHDGDFDHFTADVQSNRLFSAAEENSKVLVFNLETGKLIHTLSDLKAPHSLVYRHDLKRLFVVDGDLGVVRMYDGSTYKHVGDIALRKGSDSSAYDPASKHLYVVNGGRDADLPTCFLSVVDTTSTKQIAGIKLDSNNVEAVVLAKDSARMFVAIRGDNAIEVFDRQKRTLLATWPMPGDASRPTAMALDETAHQLFVGTRSPGKLVVLDSDTGKVVSDESAASMVDDMSYDAAHKRIYFAGTDFLDVFQQQGDSYESCGEDGPHGISLDVSTGFLFVACSTRAEVLDAGHNGAKLSSIDTGDGVDDLNYSPATHTLYVGAARAARLTVARVDAHGKLTLIAQVPTHEGARNGVVTKEGTVYLAHSQLGELAGLIVASRR